MYTVSISAPRAQNIACPSTKPVLLQDRKVPFAVEKVLEIDPRTEETAKGEYGSRPVAETNCPLAESWPFSNVYVAAALQSSVVAPFALM